MTAVKSYSRDRRALDKSLCFVRSRLAKPREIEVNASTKEIVWEYRDKSQMLYFFAPVTRSAQRLSNSNTLLCGSAFGRLFEVTANDYVCWEHIDPHCSPYTDTRTTKIFLGESNVLFRKYRSTEQEIL
ncbi:hypothetical protein D6C87_10347 [Aureobasidium pullulans]|uniref:Uncharacterized protein n=1 Tax=Aureobasidium pullulans TaxID=5580 RepID=A0AB38LGS8_AURPU|nr:hypothetical protein D6C94_10711 [Aureobasidium pullulans]THZ34578.1 hypothetical protein D6C87_10347 [Aureobasidium pullulans]